MAPFEPPRLTQAKNKAWRNVAKPDFRDPSILWTEYWSRFNTISIPIQDEDAFFADAMAAARIAENREHLEEILEQKSRDRRAELADIVSSIAISAISLRTPFATPAARSAALKVGQTGSLDSFAQLSCGVAFAWQDASREMNESRIESKESYTPAAKAQPQSQIDAHDDTHEDPREDTYDTQDTQDAQEDVQEDTQQDTREDTQDNSTSTGDPWELENAFPPDLYDVYEAGPEDEHSSEYHECDPQRVVEIAISEASQSPPEKLPQIYASDTRPSANKGRQSHGLETPCAEEPSEELFQMGPKTSTSPPAQDDQPDQIPSSPLSNELSFSGTGSVSSLPPSPVTPQTSSIFTAARISNDSVTPLHPQTITTSKTPVDFTTHRDLSEKMLCSMKARKRRLSSDDGEGGSHSGYWRKRRAVN